MAIRKETSSKVDELYRRLKKQIVMSELQPGQQLVELELAGALGMILPAATRILPWLTPLAALGFAVIQVLAIGTHALLGETAQTLPINLVLLALSLFVAWGRMRKAPILPRA